MSFVKLYSSICDGTIMDTDPLTRLVWVLMLATADKEGAVDMTVQAMARKFNLPVADVEKSLVVLTGPDPHSRSPEEDGRRLLPLDPGREWGWKITNYKKYRDSRDPEERRSYKTKWQAEKRAADKLVDQKVHNSPRVDKVDKSGPKQIEKQIEKQIRSRQEPPDPQGGSEGTSKASNDFDRFWETLPPKLRTGGKKAVRKKWGKIPAEDRKIETVLAWVEAGKLCDEWMKEGFRFAPRAPKIVDNQLWDVGTEAFEAGNGKGTRREGGRNIEPLPDKPLEFGEDGYWVDKLIRSGDSKP